jgi:type VI secretion system protein VasG
VLVALESDIAANERARDSLERDQRDGVSVESEVVPTIKARIAALREQSTTLLARWETERAAAERLFAARLALRDAKEADDLEPFRKAVAETSTELAKLQGDDPLLRLEVDAQSVARVVQSWTGIPVGKLQTDSIRAVLQMEERIRGRIKGQEDALRVVAESVRMANAGVANPETPRAVLLFVGTSGVGKTETALALADTVFGGERFLTSIAMSEFQEKHSLSRLIGSPPGYVGYGEGGVLTEAVRRHPYSVVLLDECEKADLEVMNLFYQVFDKGTLNDGEGRRVDFRNTIVILTSNLATDVIAGMYSDGARPSTEEVLAAIRPTLSRHFKPALLARMTIVPFAPMGPEILRDIVQLKLDRLRDRLRASHGADTEFAPDLIEELTARCTESETGARAIDHVLRGSLLPELSREILQRLAEEKAFRTIHIGRSGQGFRVTLS